VLAIDLIPPPKVRIGNANALGNAPISAFDLRFFEGCLVGHYLFLVWLGFFSSISIPAPRSRPLSKKLVRLACSERVGSSQGSRYRLGV